jgi:hypothetical protein
MRLHPNARSLADDDAVAVRNQRLVFLISGVFLALGLCNLLVFASIREAPYALYSLSMFILAAIGPMQANALAWEIFWPFAVGDWRFCGVNVRRRSTRANEPRSRGRCAPTSRRCSFERIRRSVHFYGVIFPMLPWGIGVKSSTCVVNHMLPSGPAVKNIGCEWDGIAYSEIVPPGVIRAMLKPLDSPSQRFPSGPAAIPGP